MLVAAIIYLVFIAILIIAGIFMLKGKAVWLISGYHSMSEEEKEKYDIAALSRFVANILFIFAGSMFLMMLGELLNLPPFSWIGTVVVFLAAIFAVIYTNTNNHFRKEK